MKTYTMDTAVYASNNQNMRPLGSGKESMKLKVGCIRPNVGVPLKEVEDDREEPWPLRDQYS